MMMLMRMKMGVVVVVVAVVVSERKNVYKSSNIIHYNGIGIIMLMSRAVCSVSQILSIDISMLKFHLNYAEQLRRGIATLPLLSINVHVSISKKYMC